MFLGCTIGQFGSRVPSRLCPVRHDLSVQESRVIEHLRPELAPFVVPVIGFLTGEGYDLGTQG